MRQLPRWALTKGYPASYDSESATAIEMVAKLYGAMSELISEYNEKIKAIADDVSATDHDIKNEMEQFKQCMISLMNEFSDVMSSEYIKNNKMISDTLAQLTSDITATSMQLIQNALDSGDIVIVADYDAETESINIAGVNASYNILVE